MDDFALLENYTRRNSEEDFRALTERYVNLVYSSARRQVGDSQLAEEITQAVFIVLARKSNTIRRGTILSAWLIRTTHYTAANALKQELRRKYYEEQAMRATILDVKSEAAWEAIAPLLDEALVCLGEQERNAIVLRFFERKSFREIALATGTTEDTAQKRVSRALERMRGFFQRRGRVVSAVALTTALAANTVLAAPIGLSAVIVTGAMANGATVGASIMTHVYNAINALTRARARTIAIRSGTMLFIGVMLPLVVHKGHNTDAPKVDVSVVNQPVRAFQQRNTGAVSPRVNTGQSFQNEMATFVEITAQLESTWQAYAPLYKTNQTHRLTVQTRCVVGIEKWRIEGDFNSNGQITYWFNGTNVFERSVLPWQPPGQEFTGVSGGEPSPGKLRFNPYRLPGEFSVVGERYFVIRDSPHGEPPGGGLVNVAWLAFCSGTYLKQAGRQIPAAVGLFSLDAYGYSDVAEAYRDSLGLPKWVELYTSDQQFVSRYEVLQSTNFLGWNFPLEFRLVQYENTANGRMRLGMQPNAELKIELSGRLTSIRQVLELEVPAEILEKTAHLGYLAK